MEFAFQSKLQMMNIFYEDLAHNPVATAKQLADFLGFRFREEGFRNASKRYEKQTPTDLSKVVPNYKELKKFFEAYPEYSDMFLNKEEYY